MLQLMFYQFSYTKRQWLGVVPVFLIANILVGICTTTYFSVEAHAEIYKHGVPGPLFIGPIIFGGLTLVLLTSSLIQLLLDSMKKDYQLWSVLGASRLQLALLVGGQLSVAAFLSSIIGSLVTPVMAHNYYYFIQGIVGKSMLPSIPITFSFAPLITSIVLISVLAFFSGFRYTLKLLKKGILEDNNMANAKGIGTRKKILSLSFPVVSWLTIIIGAVAIPLMDLPGSDMYAIGVIINMGFYLLIVHIILLQLLSPWIEEKLIKALYKWSNHYSVIMARWHILGNPFYLKSITISIVSTITLTSGLSLPVIKDATMANAGNRETIASFLFYLAAPVLVSLANIVSITILTSRQEQRSLQQWQILGVSRKNIVVIQLFEGIIYSTVILLLSLICNLIVAAVFYHASRSFDILQLNYLWIFIPALIIAAMIFVLIVTTKFFNSISIKRASLCKR